MKAVLLDIEGTTTPIDFVHQTLFPYAKARIGKYVETHFATLDDEISRLVDESAHDPSYTVPVDPTEPGSVSAYLEFLIDHDRKSTPLKSIQGMIWEHGYGSGELRSIVFDDVPTAFERWNQTGKRIAIFSSGSVLAQRLLFRHTNHGDLTPFIARYFDTRVGSKRVRDSYVAIAAELELRADEILFASDTIDELDAARDAGLTTVMTARPGNPAVEEKVVHRVIGELGSL